MSDFDEEAERERLRKQYERDRAEREATEKMSELLLQGATMTNAHCSDCGDPIFRYEGQEFCASCEKAVDRDNGDAEAGNGDLTDGDETDGEHIEVTAPDEETRVQFGDGDAEPGDDATVEQAVDSDVESTHPDSQPTESRDRPSQPDAASGADPESSRTHPAEVPGVDPDRRADSGAETPTRFRPETGSGLAASRGALERTLARLTRQAEGAEDPAQAREYLAAAREAAETLAALRR